MKKFLYLLIFFSLAVIMFGANVYAQENIYINERFGISITAAKDWYIAKKDNVLETMYGPMGILAELRKRGIKAVYLRLTILPAREGEKEERWNAFEMLESHIQETQSVQKSKFTLVEAPYNITVDNTKGAVAIYDISPDNKRSFRHKLYYFRKNNFFIQLVAHAPEEDFDDYLNGFNYSVISLKFQ